MVTKRDSTSGDEHKIFLGHFHKVFWTITNTKGIDIFIYILSLCTVQMNVK